MRIAIIEEKVSELAIYITAPCFAHEKCEKAYVLMV